MLMLNFPCLNEQQHVAGTMKNSVTVILLTVSS